MANEQKCGENKKEYMYFKYMHTTLKTMHTFNKIAVIISYL